MTGNFVVCCLIYHLSIRSNEMARETNERDVPIIGRMAANFLDFIETISIDYSWFASDLGSLLKSLQVVVGGAIAFTAALLLLYAFYVAPSSHISQIAVVNGSAIIIVILFIYILLRTRRSREDLEHLAYHMTELVETHAETVIETETVDPTKSENEQLATLLRRADFELDKILEERPHLLQFNTEVKGKRHSLQADIFVGVPWESRWAKFRDGGLVIGSKRQLVWIALRQRGSDAMSIAEIRAIREQLSDILAHLYPLTAQVYIFSRNGFSEEVVRFAEDDKNWIPHWNIGEKNQEAAVVNLIKMEGDGRFSVVSMPWLNVLRRERLAGGVPSR